MKHFDRHSPSVTGRPKRANVFDQRKPPLSGKDTIEVGKDADLVLVDPDASYVVRGGELLSKGNLTPFEGKQLLGQVSDALRGIEDDPYRFTRRFIAGR